VKSNPITISTIDLNLNSFLCLIISTIKVLLFSKFTTLLPMDLELQLSSKPSRNHMTLLICQQ
jgi:hypothetical protein